MKKILVTICIPVYNEESNIRTLLETLLKQRLIHANLEKIFIISDGSTDGTVEEVKKIKSKKIELIVQKIRRGQAITQSRLLKMSNSELTILLNGDVLPAGKNFIETMCVKYYKQQNKKIGIIGAKVLPLASETLFEKIINHSVFFKLKIFEKHNNGDNIFLCHGRARGFSKEFIKKMKWKKVLNEDAFSYIECKKLGFRFVYQSTAPILYRSPQNIEDHLIQSQRFLFAKEELSRLYSIRSIQEYYRIPKKILLKEVLFLVKQPLLTVGYAFILMYSFITLRRNTLSIFYEPSKSSKKL